MYLNTWLDWSSINISDYARENSTYSAFYFYWRDELFSRVMRLFKEKTDPIPPKEIEVLLTAYQSMTIRSLFTAADALYGPVI